MKKRIATSELRIGMFVEALEGPWWSHPFWKRSFLISSENQLARLCESGVPAVVIDEARSLVAAAAAPVPPPPPAMSPPVAPSPARRDPCGMRPVSAPAPRKRDAELERATETVRRSKHEVMRMFSQARLGRAISPGSLTPLVEEICEAVERDTTTMLKVTRLKSKNEYTYLHSVAVSALMIALARQMKLDEALTRELGLAGLLHDVGKMAVPEAILDKPGALTEAEIAIVRTHPEKGYAMLVPGEVSPIVRDVVVHHHEKVDGTGYPHGLSGDTLSLYARMGAVCDVYDAVTSDRPYKDAWSPGQALARMLAWEGHFDPSVMRAFMRSVAIYPVGQLVRLRSNRLAVVVAENLADPTCPLVRAFYATAERKFIRRTDVPITASGAEDSILGTEAGDLWFGADWPRLAAWLKAADRPELPPAVVFEGGRVAAARAR